MKITRFALLLATLGLSAAAQADTLYYEGSTLSDYASDVTVGGNTGPGTTTGAYTLYKDTGAGLASFIAYCFQPLQEVNIAMFAWGGVDGGMGGQQYTPSTNLVLPVTDVSPGPDSYTAFTSNQKAAIQKLFNVFYSPTLSAVESAGFQLALWEVEHDTPASGTASYDLGGGNFQATNVVDSANGNAPAAAVVTAANGYLTNFQTAANTGNWVLTQWSNANSQDFISAQAVPEPTTALLISLGLGGLLVSRRRQA